MLSSRRGLCIGGAGTALAAACVAVYVCASSKRKRNAKRAAALLTPEAVAKMINEMDGRDSQSKIQVFDVTIAEIAPCGDGKAPSEDRVAVRLECAPVPEPGDERADQLANAECGGWSMDQTHELCDAGEESAFDGKAPSLNQFHSVSAAVDALNNDSSICPEGMCLVLSTSHGKCYVLFRADMEARVLARFRLNHGTVVDVPEQLIFKCRLLPSFLRVGASPCMLSLVSLLGKVLGIFSLDFLVYRGVNIFNSYLPDAPDSMYENETRFYRDIRPELSIETPRCFGTLYNPSHRQFGILIEDLDAKGAVFPTAVEDVPVERVEDLLRSLAKLHAAHWEDSSWLPTPRCGQKLGRGLVADRVRMDQSRREKIRPLGLSVDKLWEGLLKAEEALMAPPLTLCHGDAHVQKTYWLQDGTVGLFDWQLTLRCSWARDVACCMGTALGPQVRRERERGLLELYLEELRSNGVREAPSADDAFLLYRKAMAWGLVIGWLLRPPSSYGAKVTGANIDKLVSACMDLQSFEALGVA